MSAKQFESFQVEQFIAWANKHAAPGYRFQFKSPNENNGLKLYHAFRKISSSIIKCDGVDLQALPLDTCTLIPVLHKSGKMIEGFTENYISKLRDDVSGQSGNFANTALLIIHNSFLDTIINSAQDVGSSGNIWSVDYFYNILKNEIINKNNKSSLYSCLLNYQKHIIQEEKSTVFGFKKIYETIENDKFIFSDFELLEDSLLFSMDIHTKQIEKRIEENSDLYKKLSFVTEYHTDQFTEHFPEFTTSFKDKVTSTPDAWKHIDFEEYIQEIKQYKEHKIQFCGISLTQGTIYERSKSQTKAGLRERHALIVAKQGQTNLELKLEFKGDSISKKEVKAGKNTLAERGEISIRYQSNRVNSILLKAQLSGEVEFFTLDIKREKSSECYKIKCTVIPEGILDVTFIKNIFLVDSKKQHIILKMDTFELPINNLNYGTLELPSNNTSIESQKYSSINFEKVWSEEDAVEFSLKNPEGKINFYIEGAAASDPLELPLALNKKHISKIHDQEYYATVLGGKDKYSLDNSEYKAVAGRAKLLGLEREMLNRRCVYINGEKSLTLIDLLPIDEPIFHAYTALFNYLEERETLPSLLIWCRSYQELIEKVVQAVVTFLDNITEGTILSENEKIILNVGMVEDENTTYYSSLHPLVLSYYLELFKSIYNDDTDSFKEIPSVTLDRLSPRGLLPYVYDSKNQYAFITPTSENAFWLQVVPQQSSNQSFIRRVVADKIKEFQKAYAPLFQHTSAPLLINAVNMKSADELFWGLVRFIKGEKGVCSPIHITFYDERLSINKFDKYNTITSANLNAFFEPEKIADKELLTLVADVLHKRVTYSKFTHGQAREKHKHAHITFFKNGKMAEVKSTTINNDLSGIGADGLLCGEASEVKGNSHFTAFGLRGIEFRKYPHLTLARLYGLLTKPYLGTSEQYSNSSAIALAVDESFRASISSSYDASIWTTLIDPKVTLDFFKSEKDVTLIHYSDQYTSSTNYDAVTATKKIDLFVKTLDLDKKTINEFNAFNGTWLLEMLTASPKIKKEKTGILAAYKFVAGLLANSDITWVPISIAEMIRVAGNIGLKISEGDFAKYLHAEKSGAISDDILFVGFKEGKVYLLPVEVKTGAEANHKKAVEQARNLLKYMSDCLLGKEGVAYKLYRSLFVRQVLVQVDHYQLYNIYEEGYFDAILQKREEWLRGEYQLAKLENYAIGIVIEHVDSSTFFSPTYSEASDVFVIRLPSSHINNLVQSPLYSKECRKSIICSFKVPDLYLLNESEDSGLTEYLQNLNVEAVRDDKEITPSALSLPTPAIHIIKTNQEMPTAHSEQVKLTPMSSGTLKVLCGTTDLGLSSTNLFWEPTNTAKYLNPNMGIIGTMGTGKTQFTKSLVTQLVQNQHLNVHARPIGLLIFDYKSDYVDEKFIAATGAKVLKPVNLPYNPLSLFGSLAALPALTAEGFAETVTRAYRLGIKQHTKLRSLVLAAYEQVGISLSDSSTWSRKAPTIDDIYQIFKEEDPPQDSLYAALDSLVLFQVFEKDASKVQSLYDILEGVVVLDLAGYPSQMQNLLVALTLDLFYTQMQKQGKPDVQGDHRQLTKIILVDEADNFMSENFRSLKKVLKEGREYGVGTILSTQEVTHFKTSDNDYAAYMQSWVVHRVAKIEGQHTKLLFNLSDRNEQRDLAEQIGRLDKHQSIFTGGDKKLQLMQDKAFWQLLEEVN